MALALAAALLTTVGPTPAQVPRPAGGNRIDSVLRVSRTNPRYFADAEGRAVYLTGSHVWWNLVGDRTWRVDCGAGKAAPFNYRDYLDRLAEDGHNFIRLWTIELTKWVECGDVVTVDPQPWLRTGPGRAYDGLPKFNLRRPNAAYFRRLRERVIEAQNRGFYVAIMLFEGWAEQFQPDEWKALGHPFSRGNNVNGLDPDRNRDGSIVEIYTMRAPYARRIQEAYVRRVVDAVGDLDNVLYEIANESGAFSIRWQYHMIDLVKRYEARKGRHHPVGMTFVHGDWSGRALYRSRAEWVAPKDIRHLTDPPAANAKKVIVSDTDHHCGGCGDATFPWKTFTRGYNPIYMDEFKDDPRSEEIRLAMGNTRRFARKINLAAMAPRGDLCSTGYCLVSPGREYLVYQPTGGSFTVDLTPGAGSTFSVEWMHPVSGATQAGDPVTGGAMQTLDPPFADASVAYLHAG